MTTVGRHLLSLTAAITLAPVVVGRAQAPPASPRDVFWAGDRDLAIRMARVCVLFEDLRIEYYGCRAPGPAADQRNERTVS